MNSHIWQLGTLSCVQNRHFSIAQVEYQGQRQPDQIFMIIVDSKPLINTYYCIWHRLDLICILLAQYLQLKQVIDLKKEKQKTSSKDRSFRSSYGWFNGTSLASNTIDKYFELQIAKIFKSNIKSHSVNAGFYVAFRSHFSITIVSASNFDCLFRINFNQARDSFQAFAHSYLKWLCCSIGIWANALFSDRLSI